MAIKCFFDFWKVQMTILRFWWSNINLTKEFKMMLYYRKTDFTATAWAHISQTLQIIVQLVCKTAVKASCFFLSLCLYSDWVAYSAEMEDKKDLFVRCSVYPAMTSLTEMRLKRIFENFFSYFLIIKKSEKMIAKLRLSSSLTEKSKEPKRQLWWTCLRSWMRPIAVNAVIDRWKVGAVETSLIRIIFCKYSPNLLQPLMNELKPLLIRWLWEWL